MPLLGLFKWRLQSYRENNNQFDETQQHSCNTNGWNEDTTEQKKNIERIVLRKFKAAKWDFANKRRTGVHAIRETERENSAARAKPCAKRTQIECTKRKTKNNTTAEWLCVRQRVLCRAVYIFLCIQLYILFGLNKYYCNKYWQKALLFISRVYLKWKNNVLCA